MASSYAQFTVQKRDLNGVITDVGAGISVAVYNDTTNADVAESPLTTIANGVISAGSLAAVPVGTRIRFRVQNHDGMAGSSTQITT